jgi:hypothetical protein
VSIASAVTPTPCALSAAPEALGHRHRAPKYLNNMAGLLVEIGRHDDAIVALDEAAGLANDGTVSRGDRRPQPCGCAARRGRRSDALARYDDAEACLPRQCR